VQLARPRVPYGQDLLSQSMGGGGGETCALAARNCRGPGVTFRPLAQAAGTATNRQTHPQQGHILASCTRPRSELASQPASQPDSGAHEPPLVRMINCASRVRLSGSSGVCEREGALWLADEIIVVGWNFQCFARLASVGSRRLTRAPLASRRLFLARARSVRIEFKGSPTGCALGAQDDRR
jgi:hypothetical protein